jgi:hypothetical protein
MKCTKKAMRKRGPDITEEACQQALASNNNLVDGLQQVKQSQRQYNTNRTGATRNPELTMNSSFTKKPMKPITMKPTAVLRATFVYSAQDDQ